MGKKRELLNQRFGKLIVIEEAGRNKCGLVLWKCLCDCGNTITLPATSLCSGNTKSCGCLSFFDLTGKRFGKLVVLSRDASIKGRPFWNCICDCGECKIILGRHLREGKTKSCGCLVSEDLTGRRFGKLVACKIVGKSKKSGYMWECLCDCGNYKVVRGSHLKRDHVRSCGCLRDYDLIGGIYERLTVLKRVGRNKYGNPLWECLCVCGNSKCIPSRRLLTGKTKSCGCLVRKGSDKRDCAFYENWRSVVFYRDSYQCSKCKRFSKDVYLNAHHLYSYESIKSERLNLDNGITLCAECHQRFHKKYGYYSFEPYQMFEYLGENRNV